MKRIAAMVFAVMLLFSCALAEGMTAELGLTAEEKGASGYTAQINSAVYSLLDFEDTSEYDNAVRGLIDAPETLELTDVGEHEE